MSWKTVVFLAALGLVSYLLKGKLWEMISGFIKLLINLRKNKQKRRDLIIFLKKWFSNNANLNVSSGRLDINTEKEFGAYRLRKLVEPLKQMRVCTLSQGANYWFFANFQNNYTKEDAKKMIADVEKGLYDQYLL